MLAAKYKSLGDRPVTNDESGFMGGRLTLRFLHGTDCDDQHIFGFGKYKSHVVVKCGPRKLARAVVENVQMEYSERLWHFTGYDCVLPSLIINPVEPPFIDIEVFSCNRVYGDKPLGVARLPLSNFADAGDYQCALPVQNDDGSGKPILTGSITVGAQFKGNEPARMLTLGEVMSVDASLRSLTFKVRWACKHAELGHDFGVSLVLLGAQGKFVDMVSEKRRQNTKGIRCTMERIGDSTEDPGGRVGIALTRFEGRVGLRDAVKRAKDVRAVYLLVTSGNQMATLTDIEKIQVTVLDGESGMELCRFAPAASSGVYSSSSALLMRLGCTVAADGHKGWEIRTYENGSTAGNDFGYLLPDLISATSDLIEGGCEGSTDDRVILLEQDDTFSVEECCGSLDNTFTLGLQWDMKRGSIMDLDLGCMCLGETLELTESITFENLASASGGITHGGDARADTGEKDDDETIGLVLNKIPPEVTYLGFYVSSYGGQQLDDVEKCYAHFFDTETAKDLCMFMIDDGADSSTFGHRTSVLVCVLYRTDGKWYFKNVGLGADGRTVEQNVEHFKEYVASCDIVEQQRKTNAAREK